MERISYFCGQQKKSACQLNQAIIIRYKKSSQAFWKASIEKKILLKYFFLDMFKKLKSRKQEER